MFKTLNFNRISLTEINMDGLEDMHEYSSKKEFYKYLEYDNFKTIEETKNYLKKIIKRSKSNNAHYWFIRLKNTDKVIGTFGLLNINYSRKSVEIGFGLSPYYWGNGYFKEALLGVLEYLFSELKLNRICAKTQLNNLSSIKSLKNSGFQTEGIMREYYVSSDNKKYDATLLSILSTDYFKFLS
jgi:[ribosomal protein S5]-alanine N-acetyltransferase